MKKKPQRKRWVRGVATESTFPPAGTFKGSATQIARTMASKRVSPKGLGSGIRMIQFFINRAGKGLSPTRRREIERAKRILQRRVAANKTAARTKTSTRDRAPKRARRRRLKK
ncbi:MAG: DUF3175 domain-containing protein [Deltaproteobacteria bacterium]|nr:DUF3175 domain-containing protein [Deltaproteobacteria bacterium]